MRNGFVLKPAGCGHGENLLNSISVAFFKMHWWNGVSLELMYFQNQGNLILFFNVMGPDGQHP